MNSLAIYQNIKEGNSVLAYNFLKKKYIHLIRSRFTANNCMIEAEERFSFGIVKLYEKIKADEIANLTNLPAYFVMICKNNFLMSVSRNKVRYSDDIPENLFFESESNYELKNKQEVVKNLLDSLPKKLKAISEKIYLEDKDHKEIADELGIKYDNVRKYQYKSIKKLQEKAPVHLRDYINAA